MAPSRWSSSPSPFSTAGLGLQLVLNLQDWRARFPLTHDTAFGRVNFAYQQEIALVDTLRELSARAPSRYAFAYPIGASFYLYTDTVNPTRHQILIPGFNEPGQYEEVAATLQAFQVPFVILQIVPAKQSDPVRDVIRAQYKPVALSTKGEMPLYKLLRYKRTDRAG